MKNRFLFLLCLFTGLSIAHLSAQDLIRIPSSGTVLTLSGLNFNLYNYMPRMFHGYFLQKNYEVIQVKYPASIARNSITKGVAALDAAIRSTPGQKIVLAHSQGAQVCAGWMREHKNDATAPPSAELVFILTGNPLRATGGYIIGRKEVGGTTGEPTPVNSRWKIIDFARRYDGWADWVQDENNSEAVANANKGKRTLHLHYDEADLFSSTHTVWQVGNTTFVLTQEELPLLKGKKASPGQAEQLRKRVEAAYTNRPGR